MHTRPSPGSLTIVTVGHGTLGAQAFVDLVRKVGVDAIVDVRSFPGSRRHPHFARSEMEVWLTGGGVRYRWERALGGFRKPRPDSPNVALRHPGFRGYADYMTRPEFGTGIGRLVEESRQRPEGSLAIMCSESVWWRCHRRLIADHLVLVEGAGVRHLMHDGRTSPHVPAEEARADPDGHLVYDVGHPTRLQLDPEESTTPHSTSGGPPGEQSGSG
jgi:uncharacterized protein (DUF488 family)